MKNFNFLKIQKAKYVYTTPNTRLSDLKYKEEIFEFFSYNSEKLNESEINEIFLKLIKFKIMKNEIIDYKNFLRIFLSIEKDWMTEDIVKNSLLLFLDKLKDIEEYLTDEINTPENIIDTNFFPINLSFYNYVMKNYHKLKDESILLLFNYLQHFGNEDQKLLKNALMMYRINRIANPFLPEHEAEVALLIIKMLRKKTINLDEDVKDMIKKFTLDLELKPYRPNHIFQELYYNVAKYVIDIKDINKPLDLLELSRKIEKFLFVNKIDKRGVFSSYENNSRYNKLI